MGVGTVIGGASLASAGIGAGASAYGASQQSNAAQSAAELSYEAQMNALNFQKEQWAQTQQNQEPFLQAGQQAVGQLSALMAPGGALTQQWDQQFTAPTAAQAAATPGYQFALQQGLQGMERGAAARGNLLSGGTLQAEQQYGQGLASQTYQQTFNNALTQYQQAYNQFQQGQTNLYNRLAGLAGTGQVSASTLGQQGQAAASNIGNIYQVGAQQQGNALQNAAYQNASGYNAAAGAIGQGIGGLSNAYLLSQLMNSQGNISGIESTAPPYDTSFGSGIWGVTP